MRMQENFLRTLERVLFFFLAPGLTDHWPCDYERKVRCCFRPEQGACGVLAAALAAACTLQTPGPVLLHGDLESWQHGVTVSARSGLAGCSCATWP